MTWDYDNYYGAEDLTPGDPTFGLKPVEVDTSSLLGFAESYIRSVKQYFEPVTTVPLAMVSVDIERTSMGQCTRDGIEGPDLGAVGNSGIRELVNFSFHIKDGAEKIRTVNTDLIAGNLALGNAAGWMAENYQITDGWNANLSTAVVNDAFRPSGDGNTTREMMREYQENVLPEADEQAREGSAEPRIEDGEWILSGEREDDDRPHNEFFSKPDENDHNNHVPMTPTITELE